MRKICAKDPPLLSVIAICANGRRDQQLYRTIGDQPPVAGKLGSQPPRAPCVAGKWGKPWNRSWCQRILTICVLFLQSSSTSMGSNAKPNQPMQCKSARCLHIDNASSLRPCQVDCAHIHQHITLLKIRIKMSNKILQMKGLHNQLFTFKTLKSRSSSTLCPTKNSPLFPQYVRL